MCSLFLLIAWFIPIKKTFLLIFVNFFLVEPGFLFNLAVTFKKKLLIKRLKTKHSISFFLQVVEK